MGKNPILTVSIWNLAPSNELLRKMRSFAIFADCRGRCEINIGWQLGLEQFRWLYINFEMQKILISVKLDIISLLIMGIFFHSESILLLRVLHFFISASVLHKWHVPPLKSDFFSLSKILWHFFCGWISQHWKHDSLFLLLRNYRLQNEIIFTM